MSGPAKLAARGIVLRPCCPSTMQQPMSFKRCMLLACCRQPGLLLLGASCRKLLSTCSSTRCVSSGSGSCEMMPASAAALRAWMCRLVIWAPECSTQLLQLSSCLVLMLSVAATDAAAQLVLTSAQHGSLCLSSTSCSDLTKAGDGRLAQSMFQIMISKRMSTDIAESSRQPQLKLNQGYSHVV